MDSRHSFSDPRPVFGSEANPTWEVDVYRDGRTEQPVFTLTLNNQTFPPRIGKKKKVAWKLPDNLDTSPKFGHVEKDRLLELFKEQKKLRRKATKRNSVSETNKANNVQRQNSVHSETPELSSDDPPVAEMARHTLNAEKIESNESDGQSERNKTGSQAKRSFSSGHSTPDTASTTTTASMERNQPPDPSSPFGSTSPTTEARCRSTIELGSTIHTDAADHLKHDVALQSNPTIPPPGFGGAGSDSFETMGSVAPGSSSLLNELQSRYFCPPPVADLSQLPLELAKIFVDTYYPSLMMRSGAFNEIDGAHELQHYYALQAQKSLSAGGAHAFCNSRDDIRIQLESLMGSQWEVRGVVAQPSMMGSVVILVTGKVGLKSSNEILTFCHSITLVPSAHGVHRTYQINNDALALLTDSSSSCAGG